MDSNLYERLREQLDRLEDEYFGALKASPVRVKQGRSSMAHRELERRRGALFTAHGTTEDEFSDFALDRFDGGFDIEEPKTRTAGG
jgi:hypothetical protein